MPVAKRMPRAGRESVMRERQARSRLAVAVAIAAMCFVAADWPCFRGPKSSGASDDVAGPTRWTATDAVLWKTALPGFGASSPITWQGRVFVTSYNGYGLDEDHPGGQEDLRIQLTALNLSDGSVAWGGRSSRRSPSRTTADSWRFTDTLRARRPPTASGSTWPLAGPGCWPSRWRAGRSGGQASVRADTNGARPRRSCSTAIW